MTHIMAHCSTGNGAIKLQRMKSYTLFDTSIPYKIRLSGVQRKECGFEGR
jgi:hypothetical protein